MAGQLPSFVTGALGVIRIGRTRIAFCQNLSISARMDVQPVMGVGSTSVHALEPILHSANFSMQILRYSDTTVAQNRDAVAETPDSPSIDGSEVLPGVMSNAQLGDAAKKQRDGNSLIDGTMMNPQLLLLSSTFDIEVYERNMKVQKDTEGKVVTGAGGIVEGNLIFTLKDCRIGNYSFSFAPGELLVENVSGLARYYQESLHQASSKA